MFLDFFGFLGFLSKLLMLVLKVTKVTTGHQKLLKMGQNSIISSFFARRSKKASAEGGSSPQELEVGPRSWPYLLVTYDNTKCNKTSESNKLGYSVLVCKYRAESRIQKFKAAASRHQLWHNSGLTAVSKISLNHLPS